MKKQWEEPRILVQEFTPNEYVSACTLSKGWYSCNIPSGDYYLETNGVSGLQTTYTDGVSADQRRNFYVTNDGSHYLRDNDIGYVQKGYVKNGDTVTPVFFWSYRDDWRVHGTTANKS